MNNALFTTFVANESAMLNLGADIARVTDATTVIFLYGNLGAGKTTFVRGFLRGKAYEGKVKSPTYTLVEPYTVQDQTVYHFDFYRLQHVEELEFMGVQDYFVPGVICLVEWPERGVGLLPHPDLSCHIDFEAQGRQIRIEAGSPRGQAMIAQLQQGAA
jgi:tRNA threonylcarbamoyladenosine biosynthesis protein TsaE